MKKDFVIKQNKIEKIFRQDKTIESIILDFDGTFIKEHILIIWVLFLLLKSRLSINQKIFFFFNSFFRGIASMIFSSCSLTSEWAVQFAYKTFRGIDINTVNHMLNYKKGKKTYAVNLNTAMTDMLAVLLRNTRAVPEISIYSQGSFTYVIRAFLQRQDVKACLENMGIGINSIVINANELETDDNGRFTGNLSGKIQTKFNRIHHMDKSAVFIGDSRDEAVIKKMGLQAVKFINWKKL